MQVCGGTGNQRPADEEIHRMCTSLKSQVEVKAGKNFDTFTAISYKTQVVAGTNFFVKVHVGGDDHIHVRIFRPLPHTGGEPEVHGVQESKSLNDPIEHF